MNSADLGSGLQVVKSLLAYGNSLRLSFLRVIVNYNSSSQEGATMMVNVFFFYDLETIL
jgi:hypothetical protein